MQESCLRNVGAAVGRISANAQAAGISRESGGMRQRFTVEVFLGLGPESGE